MKTISNKTIFFSILYVFTFAATGFCSEVNEPSSRESKIMLWNGKDLTGWKVVPEEAVTQKTWFVEDGNLCCLGKPNGYIRTEKEYSNYNLHVEWRWPENAAQGRNRNSGVFLHMADPNQARPKFIECQLMVGEAGQFVLTNGAGMTVNGQNIQNPNRQYVLVSKKQASSEKPAGQWNSYDIRCESDTIKCFVNGVLQNEGSAVTPNSGHICLQSEGSPVEFRNIYIEPINEKQR
jgi:hypothetical protein